jgi:TPR repeat protein
MENINSFTFVLKPGRKSISREILALILFVFAAACPRASSAQSFSRTSGQNSSQIDLMKLTKKADSGDIQSQVELGFAYQFGNGVEQNMDEAIRWYRKAANNGDAAAQNNLGYLYEKGPKTVKDLGEAGKWYMRAAVDGSPISQLNLGLLFFVEKG